MNLFEPGFDPSPFTYSGKRLREVAFPLGGIGTGCASLDGRGALVDWEIFGRPNKGCVLDYTFPAMRVQQEGMTPVCLRALGPRVKNWVGETSQFWDYGHGRFFKTMDGLPCFDSVSFAGPFPVARVNFFKEDLPLSLELAALSPFIPLDVEASSFPAFLLSYRLTNTGSRRISASLAWSLMNPIGIMDGAPSEQMRFVNKRFDQEGVCGVSFTADYQPQDTHYGEVVLASNCPGAEVGERWSVEGWWDPVRTFWNHFRETGHVEKAGKEGDAQRVPGTLNCRLELEPGEMQEVRFAFAWRVPNSDKYWGLPSEHSRLGQEHYATVFPTAIDAAVELLQRQTELVDRTLRFETALYDTSLPAPVIESIGCTLSVLRSPTLKQLEDGSFWAWEGCSATAGCCEGTCSHVWNYALAHAYLFPQIQRSFLNTAFAQGFKCGPKGEKGAMNFRIPLPLSTESQLWHAASDGQLGQIVQIYREWRLTGDHLWLKAIYPSAKRAIRYAWTHWDIDRDGLADKDMHNTYDINFCTPNPLTQFFYLAALRAMQEMAGELGDKEFADECAQTFAQGSERTQSLWNEQFFRQLGNFEAPESARYQHGNGCLADQVFGQLCATIAGLGYLVPREQIESALDAIYRYNFRSPLGEHENLQRVYVVGDETGLLLCSWPSGEVPAYPFPYSDEVWTGIEYQVAAHHAFEGRPERATEIAAAIRARHDGRRRNPWNEFECGSHYARSLASYGLLLAWTGLRHDAVSRETLFSKTPFRGFWCVPGAWGVAERRPSGELNVDVIEGVLNSSLIA